MGIHSIYIGNAFTDKQTFYYENSPSMALLYYQPRSIMVHCVSHTSQMELRVQGRRGWWYPQFDYF